MTATTLTLRDVADVAHVQRAVVSMWRRRPRVRGVNIPFPAPVAVTGGIERFDRDDIVSWLEATGRGNNTEARQDAPALAVPIGLEFEDIVTLICLHTLTGEELAPLSTAEVVALADQVDRDDSILLSEVRALAGNTDLRLYTDDLIEASFGPADALERLETSRLSREAVERGVTGDLVTFVRAIVAASREYCADDNTVLAPPADRALARGSSDGFAAVRIDGDEPANRAQRRRAVIEEVPLTAEPGPTVRVLSVIGHPDDAAIEAIDQLVLDLGSHDVGVIVGAASVLCDHLGGDAEHRRAQTLRPGNLAFAVRLPRGLWREAHRQSLAAWVLRGGNGDQSLRIADLDGETVDLGDLASDVTAALERTDARGWRYARRGDLASVLAGAPVVPRGVRAVRLNIGAGTTFLERVQTASLTTSEQVPGYDVDVAAAVGHLVVRQRSLGELALEGTVTMRRGSRIDNSLAVPGGTVTVLTADGSRQGIKFDPFDAARMYPRAVRTEPGDVVFLERPQPSAIVDAIGGALVGSPSRVLRLGPGAPIGPHALAAVINELAPAGTEWQTWSIPEPMSGAAHDLDAALAAAAQHQSTLRRHQQAIQDLIRNLIEGVAAGALAIDTIRQNAG